MSQKLIVNAISALLALGVSSSCSIASADSTEKCYGIAKAGKNDCGGDKNQCAGEIKVDGDKQAWLSTPTGLCDKIVNGSTKPSTKS